MINENATIEEIREYFAGDKFATEAAGCTIIEASKGHSVCQMELKPVHYNALGGVMGGAIFTLADLAFAVASNVGEKPSVAISNTIEYMSSVKGTVLTAECSADKSGRSVGFYNCEIKDDTGRLVAKMVSVCSR